MQTNSSIMLEQGELALKHASSEQKINFAKGEGPSTRAGQQYKNLRKIKIVREMYMPCCKNVGPNSRNAHDSLRMLPSGEW